MHASQANLPPSLSTIFDSKYGIKLCLWVGCQSVLNGSGRGVDEVFWKGDKETRWSEKKTR